jgi:pilus assembly protein CpaE
MKSCVISDHEALAARVRHALVQSGQACEASDVVRLADAPRHLALALPELAVVVMGPNPDQCLGDLGRVRQVLSGRLLAVGPVAEPRFILRALREGADDYLDDAELDAELPAALARMTNGAAGGGRAEPGTTVAILGASGGSGSSTLTANFAVALAREQKSVIAIDMRLYTGDLGALLDVKPNHTLIDLCQSVSRMDRLLFERSLAAHASGAKLLGSPRSFSDLEPITPESVAQVLALARSGFSYVLADLDPGLSAPQVQIASQADLVLYLLRLDFSSLRNARTALEYLETRGLSRDKIRLVASRQGQPKELPAAKVEEALGTKFFHALPDDPKAVNRANNNGLPVLTDAPSSAYSKSVLRLTAAVHALVDKGRPGRPEEPSRWRA